MLSDSKGWLHKSGIAAGFIFACVLFFLFLSLNADSEAQIQWKTNFLICLFLPLLGVSFILKQSTELYLSPFACLFYFLYEGARWIWFAWIKKEAISQSGISLLPFYQAGVLWSALLVILFWFSLRYFNSRSKVIFCVIALLMGGFFVAVNGLPNLMTSRAGRIGDFFYLIPGQRTYLHPFFHSLHPWISKNILTAVPHTNYLGDLIGLAAFPVAGLSAYWLWLAFDRFWRKIFHHETQGESWVPLLCNFSILFLAALTMVAVIFRIYSRGTMLCFLIALFYFAILFFIKSKPTFLKSAVFLLIGGSLIGFLFWAGNLQKAWWEMLSVQNETTEGGSLSANAEGALRAQGIQKNHQPWGAGKGGYGALNQSYKSPKELPQQSRLFVSYYAVSHYWTILAEEGIGSYLYFLIFMAYGIDFFLRLFKIKSRFQILLSLSFHAVIVMIMIHAGFGHLMDEFSIPLLIFIFMGVNLSIMRKNFDNAR